MGPTHRRRLFQCGWSPALSGHRDSALARIGWAGSRLDFVCRLRGLGRGRGLSMGLLAIFHRAFEVADGIAQALAQVPKLAGTEKNERNTQDQQQFRYAKSSTKHVFITPFRNRQTMRKSVLFELQHQLTVRL